MYTLLIYPGGRQVDALLLAASKDRLRLVIPGRAETSELTNIDGRWYSESGAAVELAGMVTVSGVNLSQFSEVPSLKVRSAS
jgi:hypothetical protein